MQTVSSNFLAAVEGSSTPVFTADLWTDGAFVQTLTLEQGSVGFDANQDVQGSGTLVVLDADGKLTPTSTGSPLTPFGSVVNVNAGFKIGGTVETVSLGWFLIWDIQIEEAWSSMTDSVTGQTVLVRKGSRMVLSLRDLMQKIADYKFLVPTAPQMATAWAEIVNLVGDVVTCQTPTYAGYADLSLANMNITYGEDRLQAVKSLAAVLNAEPVMTSGGQLTLRPINPPQTSANTTPTFGWDINVTQYKKTLSRDGIYNIVVAKGKDTSSNNIVAYSILDDSAIGFYSDLGPRPIFYSTDLLTTHAALQAYADSLLATTTQQNTQTVPVRALPNPAIELGDYASLSIQGASAPVLCRVIGFTIHSEGEMDVTLSMPKNWVG